MNPSRFHRLVVQAPSATPPNASPHSCASSMAGWPSASPSRPSSRGWSPGPIPSSTRIASNRLLFWGIFGAQLGVVIFLSARVHKLAPGTAAALFLGYSALTGLTMAFVLRVYTGESVATTFFVTAGTFGALALYGTVTSRSLSGLGQFLFMGLIGIVIASVVGIFWQSAGLQFVISFCGVILFTLLTAYDAQQLKAIALSVPDVAGRLVRHRRRAAAVPRLHQPVPVPAAVPRRPPGLVVNHRDTEEHRDARSFLGFVTQ